MEAQSFEPLASQLREPGRVLQPRLLCIRQRVQIRPLLHIIIYSLNLFPPQSHVASTNTATFPPPSRGIPFCGISHFLFIFGRSTQVFYEHLSGSTHFLYIYYQQYYINVFFFYFYFNLTPGILNKREIAVQKRCMHVHRQCGMLTCLHNIHPHTYVTLM